MQRSGNPTPMSPTNSRICLVTPGHVSSTPRLVKEADALSQAGYDVRVVAARHFAPVDPLDEAVIRRSPWRCHRVDACARARTLPYKLARRLAQRLVARSSDPGVRLSALAEDAVSPRLLRAAAAEKADLYIGHCIGGLSAAALSAARHGSLFGFDIEDYHDGETEGAMARKALARATRTLQRKLLPGARFLTASAPLISAKYEEEYGVHSTVVLNVFPLGEAPREPVAPAAISEDAPAVLYWFSQTVGPDRGLEEIILAIARMKTPAVLHARGYVSEAYRTGLLALAARSGVRHPPRFLPLADPAEMVRLSAAAHAGLCAEKPTVPNHELCLANKIFTYLLAGTPVLLSPTRAHVSIAPQLGDAARVIPLQEPSKAAAVLDELLGSSQALTSARSTAWAVARSRYCWDVEKHVVLKQVSEALAGS